LAVTVRLDTFVEPAEVIAAGPDVVTIATGSRLRMDGYQVLAPSQRILGLDRSHVLSSIDLCVRRAAVFKPEVASLNMAQ
jgi:hypothetical protein